MQISKVQFYFITFLFFLLPFSVNYRLLLFGEKTTGTVIEHKTYNSFGGNYSKQDIQNSIIKFEAEGRYIKFASPEDLKYPIGKKVKIFYSKKNPSKFIMFNFAGLVFNNKMIIPSVLLIIWFAFYLAARDSGSKSKLHLLNPKKSLKERAT